MPRPRTTEWLALATACLFAIHGADLLIHTETPLFRLAVLGWPGWLLYGFAAAQLGLAAALVPRATRRAAALGLLLIAAIGLAANLAYREHDALLPSGAQVVVILAVLYTTRRRPDTAG